MIDMDRKVDFGALHGCECVPVNIITAGTEGKEVGRLGMGVFPNHEVATFRQVSGFSRSPVREQDRKRTLVGVHIYFETAHNIGPVWPVCDPSKPRAFTLRAEPATGEVEPGQGGVC